MGRYIQDLIHINILRPSNRWEEYADKVDNLSDISAKLERAVQNGKILDYEIYGFTNFSNPLQNVKWCEKLYIKEASTR